MSFLHLSRHKIVFFLSSYLFIFWLVIYIHFIKLWQKYTCLFFMSQFMNFQPRKIAPVRTFHCSSPRTWPRSANQHTCSPSAAISHQLHTGSSASARLPTTDSPVFACLPVNCLSLLRPDHEDPDRIDPPALILPLQLRTFRLSWPKSPVACAVNCLLCPRRATQ